MDDGKQSSCSLWREGRLGFTEKQMRKLVLIQMFYILMGVGSAYTEYTFVKTYVFVNITLCKFYVNNTVSYM